MLNQWRKAGLRAHSCPIAFKKKKTRKNQESYRTERNRDTPSAHTYQTGQMCLGMVEIA